MKSKQLAVNIASQTASFVFSMAVSFFVAPFIIGRIGKDVYGFVGLSNNIVSYAAVITAAINGIANRYITISYAKGDIESANRYFTSATVANIIAAVILLIPGALFVSNMEKIINVPPKHSADIKVLSAFVFAMFGINIIFGRMEVSTFASNRLDLKAKRTLESNVLKLLLTLGLYIFFKPYVAYVGISAFICAAYIIITNAIYMKKLTPEIKFKKELFSLETIKEMLGLGVWNSINQLSQILFTGLDLLIANIFISASGMSILSIAKTLPVNIVSFIAMVAGVFYPQMTITYAKKSIRELLSETDFANRLCGLICSVPVMGMVVFGRFFFRLWLPSLTDSEITMIQVLAVITMLPQIFNIYIYAIYQINTITCKLKVPVLVNVLVGILNVIIVFLLLKHTSLGLYAIAGVSSVLLFVRELIFAPMYAAYVLKTEKTVFYPVLFKGIVLNVILGVVFYAISRIVSIHSWISLIDAAIFSAVIGYALGFVWLFNKDEHKKIIGVLKSKLTA